MAQVAETLFSVPPTQVVTEKGFWEDVDPVTSISSSDTIEFLSAANSGVYTDLASSYLYVKAKITTAGEEMWVEGKLALQTFGCMHCSHKLKYF
jgi:hypothetical protein